MQLAAADRQQDADDYADDDYADDYADDDYADDNNNSRLQPERQHGHLNRGPTQKASEATRAAGRSRYAPAATNPTI